MRQGCMLLSVFCLIGIIACSGEEGHDIQIPDPVICTLNYTIPDTEIPDTRASDTGGKISVARPEESAIKDVKLLSSFMTSMVTVVCRLVRRNRRWQSPG